MTHVTFQVEHKIVPMVPLAGLKVMLSSSSATILHVSCHTGLMPHGTGREAGTAAGEGSQGISGHTYIIVYVDIYT